MSRRSSTSGIAFTWIGVGVVNSMLSSVRNVPAERPRSENLVNVFSLSGTQNADCPQRHDRTAVVVRVKNPA